MKIIRILCLILIAALCIQPVFAADSLGTTSQISGCHSIDAQMPVLGNTKLINNATAMILYETNTDTLMYAFNADTQVPPSSLIKILTALVALEKGNLDDVVTVHSEVLATLPSDAAVVGLKVDEVLTLRDLLYCMMVSSGNDAAVVLANYVMGNQTKFVAEMNNYAAEFGCTGTNITNVHGLHDANQYTTARDMTRILAKALQNEHFREIFGTTRYTVPATNKSEERNLVSKNFLICTEDMEIYFDSRVTGSRTAITNDRANSLASVAEVGDMELVCIMIGSKSQYEEDGYTTRVYGGYTETTKLLDKGFEGYKPVQVFHENQALQQNSVLNGECDVVLGTKTALSTVVPDNVEAEHLIYRYIDTEGLTAPIQKGERLATVEVWSGTLCIGQTELYAMNSVDTYVADEDNNSRVGGAKAIMIVLYILGGIAGLVALLILVRFVFRVTRRTRARMQSLRNSRNRRRSR